MSSFQAVLQPRIDPSEILLRGVKERPPITLLSQRLDQNTAILGRTLQTGISDGSIDEAVICMSFDVVKSNAEPLLQARLISPSMNVHINGMPWEHGTSPVYHLAHGDIFSLKGLQYEYKVQISQVAALSSPVDTSVGDGDKKMRAISRPAAGLKSTGERIISDISDSSSPNNTPPNTAALGGESDCLQLPRSVGNRLVEEVQCSVCLEIQVFPRTFHPCGHSFCSACAVSLKQCPQCRQPVQAHTPSRELENLISTLITVPGLFDPDDVDHFKQRQKKNPKLKDAPKTGRKHAKTARRRGAPPYTGVRGANLSVATRMSRRAAPRSNPINLLNPLGPTTQLFGSSMPPFSLMASASTGPSQPIDLNPAGSSVHDAILID